MLTDISDQFDSNYNQVLACRARNEELREEIQKLLAKKLEKGRKPEEVVKYLKQSSKSYLHFILSQLIMKKQPSESEIMFGRENESSYSPIVINKFARQLQTKHMAKKLRFQLQGGKRLPRKHNAQTKSNKKSL